MELEFDKEIDAILRKARGGVGAAAVGDAHIDADAIAAFAENALPQRTRLLYTQHFADCGRCRKLLSHAIHARSDMAAASDEVASSSLSTPVVAAPWYSKLFRMPSLAVAMGVLVLMLGGTLGYFVLQDRQAESGATVARSSDPIELSSQREVSNPAFAANTNAAANTMPAEQSPADPDQILELQDMRKPTGPSPADEQERTLMRNEALKESTVADATGAATSPPAAAPAKPEEKKAEAAVTSKPTVQLDGADAKAAKDDAKNKLLAGARGAEETTQRMRRDAPAAASKVGPSRGPVQTQSNQVNTNVGDMAVTRVVGGKTFNNRDRTWYDSAYRGQATVNVRRGTDEFKKLDSGLRSIANDLGGVVVVVWKNKAYRIQ